MSELAQDTDRELLRQYAESGSHAAFAELVALHTDFVHSIARRRVGGDPHLAADVTQAVFLVLARKAAKFGPEVVLSGWLFQTTRYAAAVALRAQARRRRHEQQAAASRLEASNPDANSPHGVDEMWKDVEPLLDDALEKLTAADRTVVLLRFYQKMSFREVGAMLNISDDTAQKRVTRALQKLKKLLDTRGATVGSTAVLAVALGENAVEAAPAGMAAAISATVAGQTAASAAVASLAATVAKGLSLASAKAVPAVVAILLSLLILAAVLVWPLARPSTAPLPIVATVPIAPVTAPTVLLGTAPPPTALDLSGGVALELVGIPPGQFTHGDEQRGTRRVTIAYQYYLGKFEVTQSQWVKVMGSNPSQFLGDDRRPVERVSWDDCQEFCRRVSRMTGRIVRLPSAAEWEHACRAGTNTVWHFGNDSNELSKYAWHSVKEATPGAFPFATTIPTLPPANADGHTHPVGLKLPNQWGLYDMYGNVQEWCLDVHDPRGPVDPRNPTDGSPWTFGGAKTHLLCGSPWGTEVLQSTVTAAYWAELPDYRSPHYGLRVVVEFSPPNQRL